MARRESLTTVASMRVSPADVSSQHRGRGLSRYSVMSKFKGKKMK